VSRKHSLIEIHLAVIFFGLAGLFGKWLNLSPFVIVWGRVFFASLALGLFILFMDKSKRPAFPGRHGLFLLLGLLLAVHWTCFFQSIRVSSVAVGLLSYSSFPLFTAFLEPLMSQGRLSVRKIFYALLCLAGVFLIIPRFQIHDSTLQGVLWGLAAGLTFAVLTIFNRRLSGQHSSLVIALYQDAWAALFLTPAVLLIRPDLNEKNLILLAVLGVFCTAAAHTLFIKGMRWISAHTAAVISSLEPVYGIVLAYAFLNESPSARTLAGGGIILCAVLALTVRDSSE
jgi:drug/metabolite transporter (DMT)-like permease